MHANKTAKGPERGPKEVLQNLLDGNRRYMTSTMTRPNQTAEQRTKLLAGQRPSATVLTCADSRVVPEIIFDQGLGDLFVLRVAGNVVDDVILGSVEYGVDHLGTSLVVVLGHSDCGAVKATAESSPGPGHAASFTAMIEPALRESKNKPGDMIDNTARANAKRMARQLIQSEPLLAKAVSAGKVTILPAFYRLDTGEVELL
jgi:carbonic anhydrase